MELSVFGFERVVFFLVFRGNSMCCFFLVFMFREDSFFLLGGKDYIKEFFF